MEEQRRQADERFLDHEKRIIDVETKVENLHYHHRADKLQQRMSDLENAIMNIEKLLAKKNGDGDMSKRLGLVEKIAFIAVGAVAGFEFYARVFH